jgi:hypothetical protein
VSRNVLFRHVVTGGAVLAPPDAVVPGLWRVEAEQARQNRAILSSGDGLVSDGHGVWSLATAEDRRSGRLITELLPDLAEAENLRALGERLGELEAQGAPSHVWRTVPPLVPGVQEKMKLLPWEEHLRTRLPHLRIVCHRPRAHLHAEIERVPVSRARRVPGKALAHLAAHPEDWERRTLSGVRPRRILSVLTSESLDIYENRLAADLIDRLRVRLAARARALRDLLDQIAASMDFGGAARGTRFRRDRVYRRWGHTSLRREDWDGGHRTLRAIERMEEEVSALRDSPLYRALPEGRRTVGAPKRTNLLAKDQHYRHIADLWLILDRSAHRPPETPEEAYRSAQEDLRDFARFTWLLLVHAWDACGFEVVEEVDAEVVLRARWGGYYRVRRRRDGSQEVLGPDARPLLRCVPVRAALAQPSGDAVAGALAQLRAPYPDSRQGWQDDPLPGCPVVVVYPGRSADLAALPDQGASVNRCVAIPDASPGFVPVSTQDIDSVERLGRALRWATQSPAMLAYPPRVPVPSGARVLLAVHEPGTYVLRTPWAPAERRRITDELERAKRTAAARGAVAQTDVLALAEYGAALQRAEEDLQGLSTCPVCPARGVRVRFDGRDRDTFAARCEECGTTWGLELCPTCGDRVPYLLPRSEEGDPTLQEPGGIDRVFGADLLAEPAGAGASRGRVRCGRCASSPSCKD